MFNIYDVHNIYETHHTKTGFKIFVIIIPKEGNSLAKPSFGITLTIKYNLRKQQSIIFIASACQKKTRLGWAGASQAFFSYDKNLRPFLHDMTHML